MAPLAAPTTPAPGVEPLAVVAGLGGRPITKTSLHDLFGKATRDELGPLTFLDLDWKVVNKQLERERQKRRSGPAAENILRDVNSVAAHS